MAVASPAPLHPDREPRPVILEMRGICKRFPGVVALDDVNMAVERGEMHSVIGQNGAGKSTLMNILSGLLRPDAGTIRIDGRPVEIATAADALRLGIATVYQELSLLPNLTVAQNIFLGREFRRGPFVDSRAAIRASREALALLGADEIDAGGRTGTLPLAQQQLVEIAKALSHRPSILILDEPTAPLAKAEADRLFSVLARLKRDGLTIIFISHRFREVLEHCDRGTILRNGRLVGTEPLAHETEASLSEKMIGRAVRGFYRQTRTDGSRDEILVAQGLGYRDKVKDVGFALRRGEILGVTGLLGAGQNEVARLLGGALRPDRGAIIRGGSKLRLDDARSAIRAGICLITEDRKREGLFLDLAIRENISLPSLARFQRFGLFLRRSREKRQVGEVMRQLNVVARSDDAPVRTLSGGNQQKTILARWLLRDLDVVIFIEPTRGIDVGSKAEIYRDLETLARGGKGIVVVSSDVAEIVGLADRVLVMVHGRIGRTIARARVTEEAVNLAVQGAG
jgi:ABC-type sugar transport system ATPase subunit